MRLAAATASGFGSVLAIFGARTADERADPALALAFEEARERARAGERAHQRAAADAVGAPRRHEGAHVRRASSLARLRERDLAAEMLGEEGEELADVARDRPRRVFGDIRRSPPRKARQRTTSRRDVGGGEGDDSVFGMPIRSSLVMRSCACTLSGIIAPASYPSLSAAESAETLREIRMQRMKRRVVDVLVPVALDQAYSYRVPAGMEVAPGDVVAVPLGPRECTRRGLGRERQPQSAARQPAQGHRRQARRAAAARPSCASSSTGSRTTRSAPRGMVLRMALRMGEHLGPARERVGVRLAGPPPKRMTAARKRVLALLADGLVRSKGETAEEAGVSRRRDRRADRRGHARNAGAAARAGRARARSRFRAARFLAGAARGGRRACARPIAHGGYSATLIDGVTGSGKTAVYFEAVAETIRRGRQALILMPEIALTAQFLDRFAERFGVRPAEWHSQLSPRLRARTWAAVAAGEATVDRRRALGAVPALCRSRAHRRR